MAGLICVDPAADVRKPRLNWMVLRNVVRGRALSQEDEEREMER